MLLSGSWKWFALRNVLLTVAIGPMFGALFMFVDFVGTDYVRTGTFAHIPAIYILGVLVFSYGLGCVPAAVTGLVVCLIRPRCPTRRSRFLGAIGVGALSSVGFLVGYAYVAPDYSVLSVGGLALIAACGAFAAFLCSLSLELLGWHTPQPVS